MSFQQKLGLFDKFHKEIVGIFDNRVHFYSFSVFERKKNNQDLSRIHQSSVISNLKLYKNIKHSQLLIEGSNWLLKVIFGGCIFLSFSTKISTFWSISQRNRKFIQICVFDHILGTKVVFCVYLDQSSARYLWNFEWGTRILKN